MSTPAAVAYAACLLSGAAALWLAYDALRAGQIGRCMARALVGTALLSFAAWCAW